MNNNQGTDNLRIYEEIFKDTRDFFKYLVTIAMAIIPIILGLAGFLFQNRDIEDWHFTLLSVGLSLIFLTIPSNIVNFIIANDEAKLSDKNQLWKQIRKMKIEALIFTLMLTIGLFLSYFSIFTIGKP